MRVNDAITGAVLVIFAVAEITYTRTFPSLHGQSYGPNLFPTIIGVGLAACGVVLIVRGLLARRGLRLDSDSSTTIERSDLAKDNKTSAVKWFDAGGITESKYARTNAILILLSLLLYIFLSDWIGFVPISIITIAVLLYRLGSSILTSGIIAIIATAVIQFLFGKILLVPLPAGLLQGVLW